MTVVTFGAMTEVNTNAFNTSSIGPLTSIDLDDLYCQAFCFVCVSLTGPVFMTQGQNNTRNLLMDGL